MSWAWVWFIAWVIVCARCFFWQGKYDIAHKGYVAAVTKLQALERLREPHEAKATLDALIAEAFGRGPSTEYVLLQHRYDAQVREYNQLVQRINDLGGEDFLARAILPENAQGIDADLMRRLLSLCHPDKHGGSKMATDTTRTLLSMRN
jgi:hypothetical protein